MTDDAGLQEASAGAASPAATELTARILLTEISPDEAFSETARHLLADPRVEVVGALRRRFFRSRGVTASRYEVEAASLRRLR